MLKDTFRGDNASLISSIAALLEMDAAGVLVPHGIGGHARKLLQAAAARLATPAQVPAAPGASVSDAQIKLVARKLHGDNCDLILDHGPPVKYAWQRFDGVARQLIEQIFALSTHGASQKRTEE